MASSSSLYNFLSFLLPTKPPPPPKTSPPQLSLTSSSSTQAQTHKFGDGLVPLVAQEGHLSSTSTLSAELSSVICPSLAHANTLFFKSAYNVQVIVDDNEPEERLVNRFRREVMRAGVIQECKRRRFFENKQEEKKRRTRDAAKRNRRRRPYQPRFSQQNNQDAPSNKKEDDDDNWDLPEGDPISKACQEIKYKALLLCAIVKGWKFALNAISC
ncbi:30S ribosomal protein S21 [Quillaja saponaria]|uniref:30S ribosomal protein S21 n=1 Tax=Quillaja saponaria TaxID=32244 RepID=A0AAD7Q4T4_QUISA|nr:30S ribosomal protein S21 [Quillaja saponaria]